MQVLRINGSNDLLRIVEYLDTMPSVSVLPWFQDPDVISCYPIKRFKLLILLITILFGLAFDIYKVGLWHYVKQFGTFLIFEILLQYQEEP